MNDAHEEERRNWYAVGERVVVECHQQVAAANAAGNEQVLRMRQEMAAEANAQLASCRQVLETQAGSHTVDIQAFISERDHARLAAIEKHHEAAMASGERDALQAERVDILRKGHRAAQAVPGNECATGHGEAGES